MHFTVMTFNLRYPTPNDGVNYWPHRVRSAARIILDHDPLILGTQEGYLTMLKDLEPHLSDYAWIGNGRMGGHENEHCAIFYKSAELELREHGQFWLSETPDIPASKSWDSHLPRICTWARFEHKRNGEEFAVYNTHLDHMGQDARNRGAVMIWDHLNRSRLERSIPAIVTGDFNSTPADPPIRFLRGEIPLEGASALLQDAYSVLPGAPGLTAHSFRGGADGEPIDYIFTTDEWDIVETHVDRREIDGRYPSDHYPVIARLSLKF